jgi:DNA-binding CsgD family transcriptional regulator
MTALPILWDRDPALEAAGELLDEIGNGRPRSLFVIGEAGLGKTSVLDRACSTARERGFVCGAGRGDAMESTLPFGVVTQAFAALGGGDVFEQEHINLDGPDTRAAQFSGALRWLSDVPDGPVLIALDDLHWADLDSIALMSFLCRRLQSTRVGIIGMLRPYPPAAAEVAAGLAHDSLAAVVHLEPLNSAAASKLLAARSGRELPDVDAARACDMCGGNPLLLEQVARAVARGEEVPQAREAGASSSEHLLLARFAGLPPRAMRCAQSAAVFGTRFYAELAVRLSQLDDVDAGPALDALWRSGLVREANAGSLEFVHPLFRQALYDDLGAPVRRLLHARAFKLLCERGRDAEAAEHALRADLGGDAEVIELLTRVAHAALRSAAVATAAALFDATVEMAGDDAPPALLLDYAHTLVRDQQAAKSLAVSERLLSRTDLDALTRAKALRGLARGLVYTGAAEAAAQRFDESAAMSLPLDPDYAVETLLERIDYAWFASGPAVTLAVARAGLDVAEAFGASSRECLTAAVRSMTFECGDGSCLDASAQAARELEANASASALEVCNHWGPLVTYGTTAKMAERLADSVHSYDLALRASRQAGAASYATFISINYVETLVRLLLVDDAVDLLDRCEKDAALAVASRPFMAAARAWLQLVTGRQSESEATIDAMQPIASMLGAWLVSLWLSYTRGWLRLTEGRLDEACAIYADMETTIQRVGTGEPCEVPWAGHAVAAYVANGRESDARRVIAWLDECAEGLPCRWPRITAATGRARLAESAGDHTNAEQFFQRALDLHAEVELPFERMQTLLEFGKYLRRAGQPARARPMLADALGMAEKGGATWLAAQAQDELRIAGGRRRRQRLDPDRLTPQEERVAALAATGATSKQIADQLYVSTSTIETHLEHIYAKLGIHSRRELMAMRAGTRRNE